MVAVVVQARHQALALGMEATDTDRDREWEYGNGQVQVGGVTSHKSEHNFPNPHFIIQPYLNTNQKLWCNSA